MGNEMQREQIQILGHLMSAPDGKVASFPRRVTRSLATLSGAGLIAEDKHATPDGECRAWRITEAGRQAFVTGKVPPMLVKLESTTSSQGYC